MAQRKHNLFSMQQDMFQGMRLVGVTYDRRVPDRRVPTLLCTYQPTLQKTFADFNSYIFVCLFLQRDDPRIPIIIMTDEFFPNQAS